MKNITLTADDDLIAAARERARNENTTTGSQYRSWLASYAHEQRMQQYGSVMTALRGKLVVRRKRPTRGEMNER